MQSEFIDPEVGLSQEICHEKSPLKKVVGQLNCDITSTVQRCVVDSVSTMCNTNSNLSSITINYHASKVATSSKNNVITLPKSWSITEFNEERGQSVVFTLVKNHGSMQIPVIERSVRVDTYKRLHYYVCGRPVDPKKYHLPIIWKNTLLC